MKDRKVSGGLGSMLIAVVGLGFSFTVGPLWTSWAYAALFVLGVIISIMGFGSNSGRDRLTGLLGAISAIGAVLFGALLMNQQFVQPSFSFIDVLPLFVVGGAGFYLGYRSFAHSR